RTDIKYPAAIPSFCEFNPISGVIDFNAHMGNIISGNNTKLRLGNSLWVNFTWDSYRSRVTGKEY
ncbi:hypothetical protein MJI95_38380, partial [Salmonella enterica subsp. enterica serovar Kentucky]|nr:hypothetical protein [Salmonella enterica subsp. enterica serovar Kentucky]